MGRYIKRDNVVSFIVIVKLERVVAFVVIEDQKIIYAFCMCFCMPVKMLKLIQTNGVCSLIVCVGMNPLIAWELAVLVLG